MKAISNLRIKKAPSFRVGIYGVYLGLPLRLSDRYF
jgi:hypothetical protein